MVDVREDFKEHTAEPRCRTKSLLERLTALGEKGNVILLVRSFEESWQTTSKDYEEFIETAPIFFLPADVRFLLINSPFSPSDGMPHVRFRNMPGPNGEWQGNPGVGIAPGNVEIGGAALLALSR